MFSHPQGPRISPKKSVGRFFNTVVDRTMAYASFMRRPIVICLSFMVLASLACSESRPVALVTSADVQTRIEIGGALILIHREGDVGQIDLPAVNTWIHTATTAITEYFGHYPVKRLDLNLQFGKGNGVNHGITYNGDQINISLGKNTTPEDLQSDWMLTHEMFHLAVPDLAPEHVWMNEGLSTYLEPIARARIGNMPIEQFWKETLEGMPEGLPQRGDRGLDATHSWGRTYWGGALFWMLADVQIREQTAGRKSLDDAIKAILAAGGNGSQRWEIEKVVEVGDRATGTKVLQELYGQMGSKPVAVDLPALWKKLGIELRHGAIAFNDKAPLAEVRKALTFKINTTQPHPIKGRKQS